MTIANKSGPLNARGHTEESMCGLRLGPRARVYWPSSSDERDRASKTGLTPWCSSRISIRRGSLVLWYYQLFIAASSSSVRVSRVAPSWRRRPSVTADSIWGPTG